MSVESAQRAVAQSQREIESLSRQQADEARKELLLHERAARIQSQTASTSSLASLQSRQRELQSIERDLLAVQRRKADLAKRVADRTARHHQEQQKVFSEQAREQKAALSSLAKRDQEFRNLQSRVLADAGNRTRAVSPGTAGAASAASFDAFISHASEDKEELVRPLAARLSELGFSIWYDESQLKVGDSLRRSIDAGLARSRFGIVVLSAAFFAKNWPQYELDGLVAREIAGGKVILPLWHKVSKDEVLSFSPTLADKLALSSSTHSISELAAALAEVLRA